MDLWSLDESTPTLQLYGSPKFTGPGISELLNLMMLFFTNATYLDRTVPCPPSICSHVVGPLLPVLTRFQTTLRILHSNAGRFWTTAYISFHGFGTATRMLPPTYWHIQKDLCPRSGGIQKHDALLPRIFTL